MIYENRDKAFLLAKDCAEKMVKNKEILSFRVETHRTLGRCIAIESQDGWCPGYMYTDFPEEEYPEC